MAQEALEPLKNAVASGLGNTKPAWALRACARTHTESTLPLSHSTSADTAFAVPLSNPPCHGEALSNPPLPPQYEPLGTLVSWEGLEEKGRSDVSTECVAVSKSSVSCGCVTC